MPYLNQQTPDPEPIDCRILTAALDLYVEKGFHNVSIHDVQKLSGVSIGSIYKHFGGKAGIARALYTHLLNEMNDMIDSVLDAKRSPIEQCNRIIELLFHYSETRRNIIAYVFYAKHKEFIGDEEPICSAEPFKKMRAIVQQGMDDGSIKPCNSRVATASIFGGAIRLIHLRLDGVIDRPLPELYPDLIDATWRGMLTEQTSS